MENIICGTGHRPQFCPCGFKEDHPWLISLRNDIDKALTELSPIAVISGMAIGYDTWLAESALKLNIPVWSYIPFRGQGSNWPTESRLKYQKILDNAQRVCYISEEYDKDVFFKRDKAMVDNSSLVLSLWNPTKLSGGTYYTLQYAKKQGKEIRNLWC